MARESVREAFQEEMSLIHAIGLADDETVIFNAWRDNGGKGIEAGKFADMLRRSIAADNRKKNRKTHGPRR